MKVYKLAYPAGINLRQWMLKNIGTYGDAWYFSFNDTLTIVKDSDATYFQLMFMGKIKDGELYYDDDRRWFR